MNRRPAPSGKPAGFTLAEVALAIGIFAFAVLGIFGLLVTGLDASRSAAADTVLSAITMDAAADLRSQSFAKVDTALANGAALTRLYREDGSRTADPDDALYVCTITGAPDSPTQADAAALVVKLDIAWPSTAPASNRSRLVIPFKMARYEP